MTHEFSIVLFTHRTKTFAVAAFVGFAAVTGLAQTTQFDWVTSTPGYSAQITFDRPSSTDGNLSDIVSASLTTPNFATIQYDPTTAHLNNPSIIWSSTELTELSLDWSIGPRSNQENPELDASQFGALILNFNSGEPNPFHFDIDQTGSWVAVPDIGNTLTLLSLALAALTAAACRFKRISV